VERFAKEKRGNEGAAHQGWKAPLTHLHLFLKLAGMTQLPRSSSSMFV
jgi:hypothetical protein